MNGEIEETLMVRVFLIYLTATGKYLQYLVVRHQCNMLLLGDETVTMGTKEGTDSVNLSFGSERASRTRNIVRSSVRASGRPSVCPSVRLLC